MKSKMSLLKKVIIQTSCPIIITTAVGIIGIQGHDGLITNVIILFAVLFFLYMIFNSLKKNFENEDEMARVNQQRADSLSFNVMLVVVAVMMIYGLKAKASVNLSASELLFGFAGMNILNLVIFLYYDIRGN